MKAFYVLSLVVLLTASPGYPHFVKAALGFRLGHSPSEQAAAHKAAALKKGVGVQLLTGVNNGGWTPVARELKASGSNNVQKVIERNARSAQVGPVDPHAANGGVRHLRILGLNLYLGGRASHLGQSLGLKPGAGGPQPGPVAAAATPKASQSQIPFINSHSNAPLQAISKPIHLGAGIGAGLKPLVANAPNGGKVIGGLGGIRASVGVPGYGVGFNLGYRQGINTKSPLGSVLGLGGGGLLGLGATLGGLGLGRLHSPFHRPQHPHPAAASHHNIHGGIGGLGGHGVHGGLGGHGGHGGHGPVPVIGGHGPDAALVGGGQNAFLGFPQNLDGPLVTGLESKHHPIQGEKPTLLQAQQSQYVQQQQPQQHRGLQGPFALPSMNRPSILNLFRFRPNPIRFTFNNPQSLPSGSPIRMVLAPHPPTPAPQRPHPVANDVPPPGWSTLYSVTGPQNSFLNPLPANGQSLSKLQASLHQSSQGSPQASAQHQVPYIHAPQHQQPSYHPQGPYGGGAGHGFAGLLSRPFHHFSPSSSPRPSSNPFRNFFSNFQRPFQSAPVQDYSSGIYQHPQQSQHQHQHQQSPYRQGHSLQLHNQQFSPFQNFPPSFQNNPHHSSIQPSQLISQSRPYLSHLQDHSHIQASPTSTPQLEFPHISNIPFAADSMRFEPPPGYAYSHSTHSKPLSMNSYTMDMIVGGAGSQGSHSQSGSSEQSSASNDTPMYGPLGRRIKKAKKTRQDIIIKKQDTNANADEPTSVRLTKPSQPQRHAPRDIMETSASNSITLASSLGSTSWTPMVIVNPPVLTRKSLDTTQQPSAPSSSPIVKIVKSSPKLVESSSSSSIIKPRTVQLPIVIRPSTLLQSVSEQPQEHNEERRMILKRRRLSNSSEVTSSPTGPPPPPPPTTSTSSPSTTSSTSVTTTTSTSTVPPPPSSTAPTSSTSASVPVTTDEVSA